MTTNLALRVYAYVLSMWIKRWEMMRKPEMRRIEEAKYHNPEKQKTKTASA